MIDWIDNIINSILGGIIAGAIVVYYTNRPDFNIWILPFYVIFIIFYLSIMGLIIRKLDQKKLKINLGLRMAFLGIFTLIIYMGFKFL